MVVTVTYYSKFSKREGRKLQGMGWSVGIVGDEIEISAVEYLNCGSCRCRDGWWTICGCLQRVDILVQLKTWE